MTAVTHLNYMAASRILKFVEDVQHEHERERQGVTVGTGLDPLRENQSKTDTPRDSPEPSETAIGRTEGRRTSEFPEQPHLGDSLLQRAIIAPADGGVTPIQALFASLSRYYDCKTMCLYASCVPSAFTAHQLLKLFQSRYPSAYKVEILKVIGEVTTSDSGSDPSESEEEVEVNEGEEDGGEGMQRSEDQSLRGNRLFTAGGRSSWRDLIGT